MRHRVLLLILLMLLVVPVAAQRTVKPPLHGRHWVAITGKPLGATAGAMIFQKGGNAVDAACAMLGAVATMWDSLAWGGETQALIYNPTTKKVVGINALGAAPTRTMGTARKARRKTAARAAKKAAPMASPAPAAADLPTAKCSRARAAAASPRKTLYRTAPKRNSREAQG